MSSSPTRASSATPSASRSSPPTIAPRAPPRPGVRVIASARLSRSRIVALSLQRTVQRALLVLVRAVAPPRLDPAAACASRKQRGGISLGSSSRCPDSSNSIAGSVGPPLSHLPRSASQQERRQAVSQFQATTGPLRHPSAVAVCRVPSRRLHRSRSVRLPVPYISICASRGDNEACSSCSSSFAPEPAYARGYRLSMRGGGAKAARVGRAPNVTNALLLSPERSGDGTAPAPNLVPPSMQRRSAAPRPFRSSGR